MKLIRQQPGKISILAHGAGCTLGADTSRSGEKKSAPINTAACCEHTLRVGTVAGAFENGQLRQAPAATSANPANPEPRVMPETEDSTVDFSGQSTGTTSFLAPMSKAAWRSLPC